MTIFYGWTAPASLVGAVADHTWVTSYDNRTNPYASIGAVTSAHEDFWFCWGMFRARGGRPGNPTGFLGSQAGNRAFACCLVAPNLDSNANAPAVGTVFRYGFDGVCHQLSNQVLYATGSGSIAPMTVRRSRGYAASIFVYGVYGLQKAAWQNRIEICSARSDSGGGRPGTGVDPMDKYDEFAQGAAEFLRDDPAALAALMRLRADMHLHMVTGTPGDRLASAEFLNARNDMFFKEAARILGAQRFEQFFGFRAGEQPMLVDPEIMEAQRRTDEGEATA